MVEVRQVAAGRDGSCCRGSMVGTPAGVLQTCNGDASFTRGCESRWAAVHESTVSNEFQRSVPLPDGSPGPAWVAAQITRRVASECRGDASASLQRREKRRCADSASGTRVTRRRLYCLSMATPLGGREPSFGPGDCERLEAAELWWTRWAPVSRRLGTSIDSYLSLAATSAGCRRLRIVDPASVAHGCGHNYIRAASHGSLRTRLGVRPTWKGGMTSGTVPAS